MPDDARDVLATVLVAASIASLDRDVRAAFPQDFMTVETDVVGDDFLAAVGDDFLAAVGVLCERVCIVGVRAADGVVDFASFDRSWIQPGELGCSTRLVTSPPT